MITIYTCQIYSKMSDVSLNELPNVIYQLLLFSNKGHKAQHLILSLLVNHFDSYAEKRRLEGHEEDEGILTQVRDVMNRVLVTVTYAMRQDQGLGRAFIERCKTYDHVLSLFSIGMGYITL